MKTDKKILKSASIIAGALLTTSLAAAPLSSPDLLAYNDLGSGSQVRSHLIDVNANQGVSSEASAYKVAELKCGEDGKKEGEAKKGDAKKAEAKKGEGKCGEGKCGEGKCGEDKKADAKTADAKTESGSESKSKEAKCGEGKCG